MGVTCHEGCLRAGWLDTRNVQKKTTINICASVAIFAHCEFGSVAYQALQKFCYSSSGHWPIGLFDVMWLCEAKHWLRTVPASFVLQVASLPDAVLEDI